jgi:predicted acyl esterase
MRDGLRLFANLFRPPAGCPWAVIMSVTPYGKDKPPDRLGEFFMRLSGVSENHRKLSNCVLKITVASIEAL